MGTQLVKCNCQHEQQDAMYGKGVRVANESPKGFSRCTVCGSPHTARYATVPAKKGKK